MKKSNKKLVLQANTIRVLAQQDLGPVVGAWPTGIPTVAHCPMSGRPLCRTVYTTNDD
jgi:hypothetical protein